MIIHNAVCPGHLRSKPKCNCNHYNTIQLVSEKRDRIILRMAMVASYSGLCEKDEVEHFNCVLSPPPDGPVCSMTGCSPTQLWGIWVYSKSWILDLLISQFTSPSVCSIKSVPPCCLVRAWDGSRSPAQLTSVLQTGPSGGSDKTHLTCETELLE